ncbi:oxidative stress defense protein [Streptomyces sp. YIM 130001]|uniref:SIMPL domain-containing protein n=1 Tax=Streptomyces sp. YIM 130001 TaxID=2259644 RepID=UPI000E64C779|nr:SIMPL domain-containing protein [Streptomyces sp. YIM 130001]RII18406.1 oxidative stress defense protein [Streptomyces sp. YIM 130001]
MTTHPTPDGTPDAPRLAVRGEAHLEVDPETARLEITVLARGTDRRTALDDLTTRNTHTTQLIKSYPDALHKLETSTLSITPELHRGRGERIRAYHGRVHLTAHLTDFTALGELTTRLADQDLTRITGPYWELTPDSPAHSEARRLAVHEAVQRAREYAAALDTRLHALLELADIGAETTTAYPQMAPTSRAAFAGAPTDTPPALDLEPQRQTVHAAVNARFTMIAPTL